MKHTHTVTDLPIENQYPKLVRDKIPDMVERDGRTAKTHIADRAGYLAYLFFKLVEEATELQNAQGTDHQKEEMADVREVLAAIQTELGFPEDELSQIQASKFEERGGFAGRIIMDEKPE